MAPEQATADQRRTIATVYAFGVLAYEMLTGRRRWRRSSCCVSRSAPRAAAIDPGAHTIAVLPFEILGDSTDP